MSKKKKSKNLSSMLSDLRNEIATSNTDSEHNIPDIITFCNDPEYLNFPAQGITLRPFQRIILKAFYRGSKGNENLELTEEEIKLCKKHGLSNNDRGDVLGKYDSGSLFRELVLVWGRRSGKDFVVGIIASYEAMRLLECEGGDPYEIYGIGRANPISILTVAAKKEQAALAFQEIKEKIVNSPYFLDKIGPDGVESSKIWLLTPQDKKDNITYKEKGIPLKKGSICVVVGNSNSEGLRGMGVFVLILDEVASYKQTSGASSGDKIVQALTPALSTYGRTEILTDEKGKTILDDTGKPKTKRVHDSKVIAISSPKGPDGILWKMFSNAEIQNDRLVCRLPSWVVNPSETREALRNTNSSMSDEEFLMEFGAEFSGTASQTMFPKDEVLKCFTKTNTLKEQGVPGVIYFAHLDPATTSHNYALVIVHREYYMDQETKETSYRVVVDHIKYWHPLPGKPVKTSDVDKYVLGLKRRFYLGLVTYDVWRSVESVQKLRKHGIPAKRTHYSTTYKMKIYDELYKLVVEGRLVIPYHELLKDEMVNLQRKYGARNYKVFPNPEGDCHTDDIIDALAGACAGAVFHTNDRLPRGKLINAPQGSSGDNNIVWRSMQGTPYGIGPGQAVARALEKRASWPKR